MISIIVPVYNSGKYLDYCLGSIYRQNYQDWECILINDGSTDDSGLICDCWSKKDSRIRVFHQSNSGVSIARNNGISHARGEYITFVDSDDWINDNYLSILIANGGGCDLIVSGIIDQYPGGKSITSKPSISEIINISRSCVDTFIDLLKKNLLYGPTNKLYKSDIIRKYGINFPEGCSLGEDLVFNFKYLNYVGSIETISEACYNYRKSQSGSLFTTVHYNQFQTDYQHWKIRYGFFEKKDLLTAELNVVLMQLLWGVIYDGVFRYESLGCPSIKYLKFLKEIPDIDMLKNYMTAFSCSQWIKRAIIRRGYLLFYIYFNGRKFVQRFVSINKK